MDRRHFKARSWPSGISSSQTSSIQVRLSDRQWIKALLFWWLLTTWPSIRGLSRRIMSIMTRSSKTCKSSLTSTRSLRPKRCKASLQRWLSRRGARSRLRSWGLKLFWKQSTRIMVVKRSMVASWISQAQGSLSAFKSRSLQSDSTAKWVGTLLDR